MSYRSVKRLLGETSLERKCRLLFGGGLLLLISGSFWFYARQTQQLVFDQNTDLARSLVSRVVLEKHFARFEHDYGREPNIERMSHDLESDDLKELKWALLTENTADAASRVMVFEDSTAINQIVLGKPEYKKVDRASQEFRFYAEVRATESCLNCHRQPDRNPNRNGR